jgi:pSer/pThr/pTyr-binding forkhead associated (FHA) protein
MRELKIARNGKVFFSRRLNKELLNIGRNPTCDVVLEDPSVCRIHAVLTRNIGEESYSITHLGMGRETFMNGERITHATFGVGDELRLGPFSITMTRVETADLVLVPSETDLVSASVARALWASSPAEMSSEPRTGEVDLRAVEEPIYLLTRRKAAATHA